jgi:hypothetical protein
MDGYSNPSNPKTPNPTTQALPPSPKDPLAPLPLLPATFRPNSHTLSRPETDIPAFLTQDLLPTRLISILPHLYWAGRTLPPRALHIHSLMNRTILPAQNINLHMIWSKGRIYIKPLPPYLLSETFMATHITPNPVLNPWALGLLYSYTALIASELDLHLAHETNLLPAALTWPQWKTLISTLSLTLGENIYAKIAPRYIHGELRLSRLDKISRLTGKSFAYGFLPETSTSLFSDFYADHFGKLAAALVYVALLLTAMQVGLADVYLVGNDAFQQACYGFAVFAMVAPLVVGGGIFLGAAVFLLGQWRRTAREFGRRMREVGRMKGGGSP